MSRKKQESGVSRNKNKEKLLITKNLHKHDFAFYIKIQKNRFFTRTRECELKPKGSVTTQF